MDQGNFVPSYTIDVDDFDFQDYTLYYKNMSYLDFDGYYYDLDVSDWKEGDIDEDDPISSNEVLFPNTNFQDCTSCVSKDYSDDRDVTKPNEVENIEALHSKIMVISCPLINSLPCEFIDALNMKEN